MNKDYLFIYLALHQSFLVFLTEFLYIFSRFIPNHFSFEGANVNGIMFNLILNLISNSMFTVSQVQLCSFSINSEYIYVLSCMFKHSNYQ